MFIYLRLQITSKYLVPIFYSKNKLSLYFLIYLGVRIRFLGYGKNTDR